MHINYSRCWCYSTRTAVSSCNQGTIVPQSLSCLPTGLNCKSSIAGKISAISLFAIAVSDATVCPTQPPVKCVPSRRSDSRRTLTHIKSPGISGICSLGTKTVMRVLFAVFYPSIETVYYAQVAKLLGAKHFTICSICSSAYFPSLAFILPNALQHFVTYAVPAVILALSSSSIFTLWLYTWSSYSPKEASPKT
jgi:hypothetical protein